MDMNSKQRTDAADAAAQAASQDPQQLNYLNSKGVRCPNCRSDQVEWVGALEADEGEMGEQIVCPNCGARWQDSYVLIGFTNLELPQKGGGRKSAKKEKGTGAYVGGSRRPGG
jgi:DNA-directed RNA polymerase subunit RPC12/RpoP